MEKGKPTAEIPPKEVRVRKMASVLLPLYREWLRQGKPKREA
jgi:hypothetical protein